MFKVKQLPADYEHPYWGPQGGYWSIEGPEGLLDIAQKDIDDVNKLAKMLNAQGLDIIKPNSEYRCA